MRAGPLQPPHVTFPFAPCVANGLQPHWTTKQTDGGYCHDRNE